MDKRTIVHKVEDAYKHLIKCYMNLYKSENLKKDEGFIKTIMGYWDVGETSEGRCERMLDASDILGTYLRLNVTLLICETQDELNPISNFIRHCTWITARTTLGVIQFFGIEMNAHRFPYHTSIEKGNWKEDVKDIKALYEHYLKESRYDGSLTLKMKFYKGIIIQVDDLIEAANRLYSMLQEFQQ